MFKINKVIKVLILSDFLLQAGWGLIGPLFAIFLIGQIEGGSLELVGLVTAVYWIFKSLLQPFIANYLDINLGERDDFAFLVGGMFIANLVPLGYVFSTQAWHIVILELIRAVAMACVIPTWSAIFTRHVDRGREAFSWSLESAGIGLAAGIAGALGAIMVSLFGFKVVFVLVSVFGIMSSISLLAMRRSIFRRGRAASRPSVEKPNL